MSQTGYVVVFVLSLVVFAWDTDAQSYPNKPVRLIVPFAAGGTTDIVARIVAKKLEETWGQSIVVDNRGGAGGNIGAELAARAAPDGYTLFMASGSVMTANQHMYKKLSFNPEKDFVAITNVATGPHVVAVANAVPAKGVEELISLARAKPGSLTYGSAGIGSQIHLAAEMFLHSAGISGVHVPYKGGGPGLTALASGEIQLLLPTIATAMGLVKQGRVRAIAVTSKQRSAQLPNVPTVAETLQGFESQGWFGLVASAGTPKGVVDKVYRDTVKVLGSAEIEKRFEDLGMAPVGNSPTEFAKAIREESKYWAKIIRARNLAVN